ncbi:MAG: ribonuclease P protein component [Treponema sp.]|jgi:ribonuclease P protein component|nr:ribonuclease P protein component [Treponema sp.]
METYLIKTGFFKREERIKNPADFKKLFKCGKKISIPGAKMYFLENSLGINRVGFPLISGYGNAVERNLSKRYSREVYRLLKSHLNTGYDILFLIFPGKDSFNSRCEQIRLLCQKAGLLKEDASSIASE